MKPLSSGVAGGLVLTVDTFEYPLRKFYHITVIYNLIIQLHNLFITKLYYIQTFIDSSVRDVMWMIGSSSIHGTAIHAKSRDGDADRCFLGMVQK